MKKNNTENVVYVGNNSPKKKSSFKIILIAIIVVVVGGGVIGSMSNTKTDNGNSTTVSTNTNTNDKEEKPAQSSEKSQVVSEVNEISNIIYDKNGIKITYKGLEKEYISTSLKFLIENSNNEKYTVQTTDISIDGYTMGTIMSASVSPGKKTNDTISLLDSYIKDNGLSVDTISEAEMDITIWSDSDILNHQKETVSFKLR